MLTDKNDKDQFERYLAGKMSNEEAHAFERDVLNDPFAQEALEGFEGQSSEKVFSDIEKLQSQVSSGKKVKFSLMRIAAVVSLLMVSSFALWLVVGSLDKDEALAMESEVVEEKIEEKETEDNSSELFKSDSAIENSEEHKLAEATPIDEGEEMEVVTETPIQVAEIAGSDVAGDELNSNVLAEVVVEDVALEESSVALQSGAALAVEDFDNSFTDDSEEVVDVQLLQSPPQLDPAESLSLASEDEVRSKKTQAAKTQVEAKKEAATPTGAFARSSSSGQVQTAPEDRTAATPKTGDKEYQNYIKGNLIYPQNAKDNGIKGTVILELTISSTGEITDIDIERSLGYGCDEEAIRLIREGPEWISAKRNGNSEEEKVRVRVRFKPK